MKVYVWTLPTRIFHWLLVLFTLGAFITSEWDELLSLHVAFGSSIFVLVIYRIVWAVFGPKYSRLSDFSLKTNELREYLFSVFNPKKEYIGHNPAASFLVVAMIFVFIFLCISGFLTYGIQENRGIFAFLHNSFFKDMELFEEIHELFANTLWLLIFVHVTGVLLDFLLHKRVGTLKSIFYGYKNIEAKSAKLTLFQKVISVIGIGLTVFTLVYTLSIKENIITARYNKNVDYEKEHPLFSSECSSCHILYPPTLLPKKSWKIMMSDLQNHFDTDASLDKEEEQNILAYLLENSAENSTSEASVKILQSMLNQDIIAITQTPFWKRRHAVIDESYFKNTKVKSKANCKACHNDIQRGLLEDSNIKLPQIMQ